MEASEVTLAFARVPSMPVTPFRSLNVTEGDALTRELSVSVTEGLVFSEVVGY